ncbi:MAG TPA: heme lyase CcmF/NrfE family subunit [Gemmatimonadaceae bacterium]|nr:heme lyase CcmF/NrfE family subunit [Gemmatimonadaceae bacterium]
MTRILGASAVMVAFGISIVALGMLLYGIRARRDEFIRAAYAALYVNFALLLVANLAMVWALATNDFSVSYVAQVGSRSTPLFYAVISLWGALEGSILFWGLVLAGYAAAVIWLNREQEGTLVPWAAATLFGISIFFYLLLIVPANPFEAVFPVPADGPGPNPLLQNHILMAIHPPLLYLGYVGLSVPFAFAIGALMSKRLDDWWIRTTRRWTLTAWAFLSAAVVAGMWWSYEVLGWGGYWAWDPVENASFMPWLTATAFLHSVMVEERRGMLKLWNVSLVIATFLLTILGTFLTRSGVLSSVHAFAEGPIGMYFLIFMAIVLLFSLVLIAGRSTELRSTGSLDAVASRETVFLANNLIFTAFTFTVLLGTLFPLAAEAVRGVKVSVGEPFFNRMTLPLCMALLFLVGVGPALPWRAATMDHLRRQFLPPLVVMIVVAAVSLALGVRSPYAVLAFAFGGFALYVNGHEFVRGARARMRTFGEGAATAFIRLFGVNGRRYGGYTAHIGMIVLTIGIAASSAFKAEADATLRAGETLTLRGHTVRYDGVWGREEPQRFVVGADLSVMRNGQAIATMTPRLNFYTGTEQPISTPAVRSRPNEDLYINLMAFHAQGEHVTIRALVEPLVMWIWIGGGIMGLGALIALWPRRRPPVRTSEAPVGRVAFEEPVVPRGVQPVGAMQVRDEGRGTRDEG